MTTKEPRDKARREKELLNRKGEKDAKKSENSPFA
jgi:hypothetical protein